MKMRGLRLNGLKGVIVSLMIAMLVNLYPAVSGAADAIFDLEGMMDKAEPVADDQLDEMRGGAIGGIFFSIYFAGFWDNLANNSASTLDYEGNVDNVSSSAVDADIVSSYNGGEQVTARAVIGGLNGAQGIFMFTQVPGNMNIVYNNMIIELVIVNVMDSQLNQTQNLLSTNFGL